MTEDANRDHEAYFQSEVDHAKRKARQMIVDDLFQFADDHRAYHELEQPLALAIDRVHDELLAWAKADVDDLTKKADELEKKIRELEVKVRELEAFAGVGQADP